MHIFIDFKGFKNVELDLFRPLTVLIGPNGSGKSNVIEAVELFSFIAHGGQLHEIRDIGKGMETIEIRGGLQSCPTYGKNAFTFSFEAVIPFVNRRLPFTYSVTVETVPKHRISDEKLLFDNGTLIFKTDSRSARLSSSDIEVEFNNFKRGYNPKIPVSENVSVLSQYKEFAKNNKKYKECVSVVNGIMSYLHSSFIFDPNPKLMRTYERIGNNVLLKNGSNISAVLYQLSKGNQKEKDALARLLNWIKQLPEEPYQDFGFVTTELQDVIFGFKSKAEESIIDARLLSDGTLRCLAVLTAFETVAESSRVVIEEFDNGLHPSRASVLMDAIDYYCKNRKLNVLVTTHNPATLNALKNDQLSGVVFCSWHGEEKTFKLLRFSDLPRKIELIERGRLGDLVTKRIVDKYLAPQFEKEHNQKTLEWLRSLQ